MAKSQYTQERADAVMELLDKVEAEVLAMFPDSPAILNEVVGLQERLQLEFEELANSGNPWVNVK